MKKKKLMFEEHIIAALLLVMLAIMGVNIITRTLFGLSLDFTQELVVYLFAICSIVGASAACAHGANMGLSGTYGLNAEKGTGGVHRDLRRPEHIPVRRHHPAGDRDYHVHDPLRPKNTYHAHPLLAF